MTMSGAGDRLFLNYRFYLNRKKVSGWTDIIAQF
jgi:hypothetical protein